ncbi:MAG: hypothetical protein ACQETH_08705, partial [Candidatus Rifleibacteriota bacterium]
MKLSSTFNPQASANLIASSEGKSLLMINGRPVQINQNAAAQGKSLNNPSANNTNLSAENAPELKPAQLLNKAGLPQTETNLKLISALREFGIAPNPHNIKKAALIAAKIPDFATDQLNLKTLALILQKNLSASSASLVKKYLTGELSFARLLELSPPELINTLKKDWNFAKVINKIKLLLQQQDGSQPGDSLKNKKFGNTIVSNLQLQEILSQQQGPDEETRLYFQWPLFWNDQDLPDTLEGEAYFFEDKDRNQGFCLRMLVEPDSLGQIEVAMNYMDSELWVHFGTQQESLDDIKSIFSALKAGLQKAGFNKVRLTAGLI